MEKYIKQTNFEKHFDYFITKIKLGFKLMREYKINTYSMIFFDIILLITSMISFSIVDNLTNEFLDWNLGDFFLFFLFNLLMWKFLWFHNLRDFQSDLLSGKLNSYLTKPINVYFQTTSKNINGQSLISGFFIIVFAIIFILYQNYYLNYFYACLNLILGNLYFILFFNFFKSFYFFMKKNELFLIVYNFDSITRKFTPKVFENLDLVYLFYLTPVAITSYFTIEILNDRFDEYLFYLPFIFSTLIIFIIGTYLLWYYGLKKYEAFG